MQVHEATVGRDGETGPREEGPEVAPTQVHRRNRFKAMVTYEPRSAIKDYGRTGLLARWCGRFLVRREVRALRRLEGTLGVPRFEGCPTPLSIKMSRLAGVNLRRLGRVGLSESFLDHLKLLFKEMHRRGVAHGDAHFSNILVHGDEAGLVDFSSAVVRGRIPLLSRCVFHWFRCLDQNRLYKVERRFFGRGDPPRMFFLYRLLKSRKVAERVWSGAGLLAAATALVFLASPTTVSLWIGGSVVALGAALRIWASGHLLRNKELATSGPYAFVRDPLYLGRLLIFVGLCTMAWGKSWTVLLAGLAVFFLRYMPRKHAKEMTRLEKYFGSAYARYAAQVHSLLPRLRPYPEANGTRWSFRRFALENKEPILLAVVAGLSLLLVARMGWAS